MEILFIVLIVLLVVGTTVCVIVFRLKKEEKEKYYTAAGNILKEDFLNYALQNPLDVASYRKEPNAQKTMLYLKTLNSKPKVSFVFDPEKGVLIGRDKENSNIYLNEALVSKEHCQIYSQGFDVYLKDMNSANGTIVSRGLFKKYFITSRAKIQLKSGDKITVGSNTFRIVLFYYDMVWM